jgi:surfactin synthase thioesterase subunit
MKKIKLFCLPHAGGFAMYYNKWKSHIEKNIEIIPLELSGRGRRMSEDYYNNFDEAINDLLSQVIVELDGSQFAFWGHSMGAMLAYELAHKIMEIKNQEPINLFMSGRYPPHIIKNKKSIHLLCDEDFIEEIIKFGGMPIEVLQDKNLMEVIIPILRADFKIIGSYEYVKRANKFNCDIVALTGNEDNEVKTQSLLQWEEHTNGSCYVHELGGGHFYINNNVGRIINIINAKILDS